MKRKVRDHLDKIITVILLIALAVVVCALVSLWDRKRGEYTGPQELESTILYRGEKYTLNKDIETLLLLGLDAFEGANDPNAYNNNMRADFLMLLVVNHRDKTAAAIHINRDTMADIHVLGLSGDTIGTVKKQISLAHTYGNGKEVSCRNTANAVSQVLRGVEINHYLSCTMDAVPAVNDLVGGVTVTVPNDFVSEDETLIPGETVTLFGDHALNFVRSRTGTEDGNYKRMERQRIYLDALIEKLLRSSVSDGSLEERLMSPESLENLSGKIVTDRTVGQLDTLIEKVASYTWNEMDTIDGELKFNGQNMEFTPDEASVLEAVVKLFYRKK